MSLPILPLLIAGGAAVLLLSKPKKTAGVSASTVDKGFKIITPCEKYEIYNKPKSYEYAYKTAIKEIDRTQKTGEFFNVANVFDKILGCRLFETEDGVPIIYSQEYYSWIYFLYREITRALIDKKIATLESANTDLENYRKNLTAQGLDSNSLPTLW